MNISMLNVRMQRDVLWDQVKKNYLICEWLNSTLQALFDGEGESGATIYYDGQDSYGCMTLTLLMRTGHLFCRLPLDLRM